MRLKTIFNRKRLLVLGIVFILTLSSFLTFIGATCVLPQTNPCGQFPCVCEARALEAHRASAILDLENHVEALDEKDFTPANWSRIEGYFEDGKAGISSAENKEVVNNTLNKAKENIDEVKLRQCSVPGCPCLLEPWMRELFDKSEPNTIWDSSDFWFDNSKHYFFNVEFYFHKTFENNFQPCQCSREWYILWPCVDPMFYQLIDALTDKMKYKLVYNSLYQLIDNSNQLDYNSGKLWISEVAYPHLVGVLDVLRFSGTIQFITTKKTSVTEIVGLIRFLESLCFIRIVDFRMVSLTP